MRRTTLLGTGQWLFRPLIIQLSSSQQERLCGGTGTHQRDTFQSDTFQSDTYQKELPVTPATAVREEVFGGSKSTLAFPRSKGQGEGGVPNRRSGWGAV